MRLRLYFKLSLVWLWLASCLTATTTVTTVCASGCTYSNLQTAINTAAGAATGPQVIVLTAGQNFDTGVGFYLPARTGAFTGWITIRSSRVSELPAKTRVVPADVAKMATLRVTAAGYTPAIYTSGHPSSYWRLEGLEFTISAASKSNHGWLIGLGYGTDELENEMSRVSHHFVIDRCYIHGIANDNGPRDGVRLNADNVQLIDSYISEIKRDDGESHGVLGYSLNGPLLVRNTFIGGAAIGSLIGGSNTANVTIQPHDAKFLGNHYQGTPTHRALRYGADPQGNTVPSYCSTFTLYSDPYYQVGYQTFWDVNDSQFWVCIGASGASGWVKVADGITGNVCVDGDFWQNTAAGTYFLCTGGQWASTVSNRTITGGSVTPFNHFWSKNRFELKKITGALVEGNLIENCFSPTDQQQACSAILLNWVTDQDQPWSTLRDIKIQNNLTRRTTQLIAEGMVDSPRRLSFLHRFPYGVTVDNNLVQDGNNPAILGALYQLTMRYDNPPVVTTGVGGVGISQFGNSRFSHNTVINPLVSTIFWPGGLIYSEGNNVDRQVTDNIFEFGNIVQTASWTGGGGCLSFDGHWVGSSLKNNLAVNLGHGVDASAPANYDTADCQSWAFPWNRSATGLRNSVSGASITGGYLVIGFANESHGMLQGTRIKLTGWSPSGLNGIHTIPRLGGSGSSSCASLALTAQTYQQYLCLPTAEVGTVTPGAIEATVGYTDYATQNFRLAASTPYKGWATDGSDPGVNQDAVEWATATASSGADNPYLDFRVRSITPTSDGAVFKFTAYSSAACTWETGTTRAFGTSPSVSQTRTGREGSATITGLTTKTGYWYRVTCDSKTRDGEFVTW